MRLKKHSFEARTSLHSYLRRLRLRAGVVPLAVAVLVSASPSNPVSAQNSGTNPSDLLLWGINTGMATLSAWIQGRSSGASLGRVLAGGVAGGSLIHAGQRILATRQPELRLVGLETVALGANVARNVGRRAGALSDLTFPFYPFYVRVRHNGIDPAVSVRLSAAAVVSTARMAAHSGRRLHLLESLYSGAAVFRSEYAQLPCGGLETTPCREKVGEHQFGAVTCTSGGACDPDELITHELLHVTQDVRDAILFAVPASDYILGHTGSAGSFLSRFMVVDAILPFMVLNGVIDPSRVGHGCGAHRNFYECEVEAFLGH